MTNTTVNVSEETDFDVGIFNSNFETYIDTTLNAYEKNEQKKLDELNSSNSSHLSNVLDTEHPLSSKLSDVPSKIIKEWDGLLGEIYSKKSISGIQLNKNNRLFYLTLSLFIFIIVLYFIFTLFS
jgi:hypothetical protein